MHQLHTARGTSRPADGRRPGFTLARAVAAAAAALLAGSAAVGHAQIAGSWIGGGTGNWTNSNNWSSHPQFPTNGGTAVFNAGQASVNLGTTISLRHLRFDTPGQVVLTGNTLSFQSGFAWIEAARSKQSAPGTHYYNGHDISVSVSAGSFTTRFSGPGAVVLNGPFFGPGPTLADGGAQLGITSASGLGTSSPSLQIDGATLRSVVSTSGVNVSRPIQVLPGGGTFEGVSSQLRISSGTLVGGGPLAFGGPAGVRLETNALWAGDARIVGGGTAGLTLANQGALPFYNTLTVGGQLNVEYFSGAQDRLGAGTLALRGGTVSLNGSSSSESVGTVVLVGGQNVINLPGTSGTFTLNATHLHRAERATLRVVADGLGGTSGFGRQNRAFVADASDIPLVGGGGTAGSKNVSIIPYAHAVSFFGSPHTFVTYDPAVGLRALDVGTEFSLGFPAELVSTDNVRSSGEVNINEPRTINSLLHGGLPQSISGSGTLTITSGAMMGAGAGSMSGFISCAVDFGSAEGVITNMTVLGPVTGTNGVTIAGTSTFSSANATYTGPTTINSGTLTLPLTSDLVPGQPGPLGTDTSPVVLMGRGTGAVLQMLGSRTFGRDLLVKSDPELLKGFEPALRATSPTTFSGAVELLGPLRIDGSAPITITGTIGGPGRIVIGTGTSSTSALTLTGANTFSGGVHLSGGTLTLLSDGALGTGALYIGDSLAGGSLPWVTLGTFTPGVTRTIANPIILSESATFRAIGAGGGTAVFNGPIDLNGEVRSITVDNLRVTINGPISGGELRWGGEGTLAGANAQRATYLSVPPANFSHLTITHPDALGGTHAQLTQVGSIISGGNTRLALRGGIAVPAHPMQLFGTLRSDAGDNAWLGGVTALGAATMEVANDTLTVAGGITGVSTSAGFVLRKTGPGTLAAKSIRGGGELDVRQGLTRLLPDGTAAADSRVGTLTIAGAPDAWTATFDLADNLLAIDYPEAGPSPIQTVANQVKSGHAGGAWTGTGITSSVAAVQPGRGVGYIEAAELGYGTIAVGGIDSTTLLVRYTLYGDADLSRTVDIADFSRLASNFNQPASWSGGDFDYDGTAGIADFALLAGNFNLSLPAAGARAAVPEPAGAVSAAAVATFLLRRRRG